MKASVHQHLTRLAVDLCSDKLSEPMRRHAETIAKGTVFEDKPTLERILNWHFYRAPDSTIPQRRYLFIKPTSEHELRKHIGLMRQYDTDNKERYEQLGRVLHHIQDMSTPSHVLAIYHDHKVEDHFETFVEQHKHTITTESVDFPDDDDLIDLEAIYHRAAEVTADYIDEGAVEVHFEETPLHLPLSDFWQSSKISENPKLKGFGTYGKLHTCFASDSTNAHVIDHDDLLAIQNDLCSLAIADTCRALLYADSL
jgi:hypothetical protein